jgi:hypothetical protein
VSVVKKLSLGLGLLLTLFALPVAAREPLNDSETPFIAIGKLPDSRVQEKLDKLFYRWQSYELDLPGIERRILQTGSLELQVGGRVFAMDLERNDLRAPGFKRVRQTRSGPVVETPSPIATFKGHLKGDPESIVRLLIQKDLLQGYIRTQDEWIFIDPLLKYAKGLAPSEVVVFDDGDVRPEVASLCGAGELAHRAGGLRLHPQPTPIEPATGFGEKALISAPTLGRADVATEADYEYYLLYGANTNNQIEGVINQVDGIYQADLALTLRITFESVWTVNTDPYTSTDPNTLLGEFTNYWNANRGTVSRDMAHLFTGKDMDGSVIGIAWVNVVCNSPSSAYGVSQDYVYMTKLVAHEMGHNFGANHDDQVSPPGATCNGSGPIMCSFIQASGPNNFSDRSKTDITTHVDGSGSCLDRLSTTYYTILTSQVPDTTLAGTGYEAGNQFSSSQDGYITALRFWKAVNETGTHVGRLWTNGGTQLAQVTFTNETSSGWQEQYLPFRVKITSGTLYWVTYNENSYQSKTGCGLSSPITNGPLTAWTGAYSNANSSGTFPTNSSCSNFFADVYFTY